MAQAQATEPAATRTLLVFVGLQMGQVMSSLDGTIVATALPSIVDDVGGRSRATLVVVAYSLAVVASMPLYGKLGDLFGRRKVFLAAITIFLASSIACGAAQTMDQLLVARFVQGIGGGGLGVLSMATLADIVPARKLGTWLGYQGVIYAVASLIGPFVGGLFVDHLSWRWAFFVNLPVGLASAAIVAVALRVPTRRVRHRLDYAGAALLTAALAALVVLSTFGGSEFGWTSPTASSLVVAIVLLAVLFVAVERRAAEPVLPLSLFREPVMRAAAGINFTSGLLLWCALFFVPLFLQEVLGVSPTRSGLVLMPLMFGAALGTLLTGRWVQRSGRYRTWPIAGGLLSTVAMCLLAQLDAGSPAVLAAPLVLLLGTGVGFAMQPSLIAAQNAVAQENLGTATSTALLFRTLGNTIGTPILGGILFARLPAEGAGPADYAGGLSAVFVAAVPVGVLLIVAATRLRDRPLREALAGERVLVKTASMALAQDDHYVIISSDCHAGGSHEAYRGYLEAKYLPDFDAWRGEYKNPYKDLGDTRKFRNWDNELRNGQQEADGIVAEVIFPNTVPPFFPSFVLFAKPPRPEEYEQRLAGIRAHNRWLVDWCNEFPERRAGVGQVFLNDVDDTLDDIRWIKEHGLRGGILLPNIPPNTDYLKPLYDPCYDPVWALCEELEVPVTVHGGTGGPDYGPYPVSMLLYINEVPFYSQRPLVQFILSGVFERFPHLRFVMTETGCAWVPGLLERLDTVIRGIRDTGATGEIRYGDEHVLKRDATEYFHQNCWMGVSQPGPADVEARHAIGLDRFMWGSDYPHDEGTHPYTREHLRSRFASIEPSEVEMMLTSNAAKLYGFDVEALQPLARKFGPTVAEVATPIDAVPTKRLERLSGDMDPKAIK